MHICVSKLTIIGSDNGLSPGWHQAIIWTNAGILLIRPLGTNFNEMLIEILIFSFMKMHLKVSSAKWRPFCLGLNVLINTTHPAHWGQVMHKCQWTGSSLVKVMAWHLSGAKPQLMMTNCQLQPKEHISVKSYFQISNFHSWKCIWKCNLQNVSHFVSASMW